MEGFIMIPTVCFIACHGASSDHFVTFIERSQPGSPHVLAYSSLQIAKKFDDKKIPVCDCFSVEETSSEDEARRIAIKCSTASVVITDVGHRFSGQIQKP